MPGITVVVRLGLPDLRLLPKGQAVPEALDQFDLWRARRQGRPGRLRDLGQPERISVHPGQLAGQTNVLHLLGEAESRGQTAEGLMGTSEQRMQVLARICNRRYAERQTTLDEYLTPTPGGGTMPVNSTARLLERLRLARDDRAGLRASIEEASTCSSCSIHTSPACSIASEDPATESDSVHCPTKGYANGAHEPPLVLLSNSASLSTRRGEELLSWGSKDLCS